MDDTVIKLYQGLKRRLRYGKVHDWIYSLDLDRKMEHNRLRCLNDIFKKEDCYQGIDLPKEVVMTYYHYVIKHYHQNDEDFVFNFIRKLHQTHGLKLFWTNLLKYSSEKYTYSRTFIDRLNDFILDEVGIPDPNSVLDGDDLGGGRSTYPYFIGCNKTYEALAGGCRDLFQINLADQLHDHRLFLKAGCDPDYRYFPNYAYWYSFENYLDNMFDLINIYGKYTLDQIKEISLDQVIKTEWVANYDDDKLVSFADNCRMAKYLWMVTTEIYPFPKMVEKIEKLGQIYRDLVKYFENRLVVDLIFRYL